MGRGADKSHVAADGEHFYLSFVMAGLRHLLQQSAKALCGSGTYGSGNLHSEYRVGTAFLGLVTAQFQACLAPK